MSDRCTCEYATASTLRITRLDPRCRIHRALYEHVTTESKGDDTP